MTREPISATLGDLSVEAPIRELLERYVAALLTRNAVVNLTAARTPQAVAEHVRDSLALVSFVRDPLVDVGSGGGFPAIPLAIATGCRATLIESVAKKAAFLREVVDELGLPIDVVCARAEDIGRDPRYRARFACATARAVSGVTTVLELTVPLLVVGGAALLQRGKFDAIERAAAHDAALVLGAMIEAEIAVAANDAVAPVPDERRLIVARKLVATGPRFPRRAGTPAKRPLCVPESS